MNSDPHRPAPGFRWTEGADAAEHTLAGLRGRPVLLLFYPLAYAHTCREDIVALNEAAERLGGAAVERLAISLDAAGQARCFFDDYSIRHLRPVADSDLSIARAYEVVRDEGLSERASVLIDAEGNLVESIIHDLCFPRPVELLEGWLRKLGVDAPG